MATLTIPGLEELLGSLGLKIPLPHFSAANILTKPLDIGRTYLGEILCSLVDCDATTAYGSIQWPNDIDNGDLAVILPKLSPGADPHALAFDLIKRFPECRLFTLPFPEGVHLRIMFQAQRLPRLLIPYINDRKEAYGGDISNGLHNPSSPDRGQQKLLIEFSSPNITSEFQGKHLRSTILGAYIANLYEAMGWDVFRMNYLGDWGKPIGLLGIGWEKFGSEELFQANPAGHLLDVYNKVNDLFIPEQASSKKTRDEGGDTADIEAHGLFAERNSYCRRLEEGEETAMAFWNRVRGINIENYTKFYSQLGVTFDEYSGESQVDPKTMREVEDLLKAKGLVEETGGAWTINLKKHAKKSGMAIIRDRTGSSTYLLRDLAAVLERSRKYSFHKMIYVVAADQHTVHFSRLFKILELMDMSDLADKLKYVSFSEAPQMSKNLVHGHMLDEIIRPYQTATQESLKDNSEKALLLGQKEEDSTALAVAALLTQDLSTKRANDHAFDISQVTSFEPGTGLDLLYWHARLRSILEDGPSHSITPDSDLSSLKEDQTNLLRILIQYPEITHGSYKSLESAPVLAYLFTVTGQLALCLDEDKGGATTTLAERILYATTRIVLENGMKLLGIQAAVK